MFWPSTPGHRRRPPSPSPAQVAEDLALIDDALELAASADTSTVPEFSLLKGDRLWALTGAPDAEVAAPFHQAYDGAGTVRRQNDAAARGDSDGAASGGARAGSTPTGCYAVCTTPSPRVPPPVTPPR